MSVLDHPDFRGHESVSFFNDAESGLRMIIAIHNTAAGPVAASAALDGVTDAAELSARVAAFLKPLNALLNSHCAKILGRRARRLRSWRTI